MSGMHPVESFDDVPAFRTEAEGTLAGRRTLLHSCPVW